MHESPPPTRRTARYRRGLVVEVAPGVVDATAIVLPSPHTDVVESCVPVFDPLDSDEEGELEALSRFVTGVPAVGH